MSAVKAGSSEQGGARGRRETQLLGLPSSLPFPRGQQVGGGDLGGYGSKSHKPVPASMPPGGRWGRPSAPDGSANPSRQLQSLPVSNEGERGTASRCGSQYPAERSSVGTP